MSFNDAATAKIEITPGNVFRFFPVPERRHAGLYQQMVLLSEGTTGVDKERGFRQKLAVAGYRTLEPFYKAVPQAAIIDGTIFAVPGVHYNFEEYVGGSHCETGAFFEMNLNADENDKIKLTPVGRVALFALEEKFSTDPELGTVQAVIAKFVANLNRDLVAHGYAAIQWPVVVSNSVAAATPELARPELKS